MLLMLPWWYGGGLGAPEGGTGAAGLVVVALSSISDSGNCNSLPLHFHSRASPPKDPSVPWSSTPFPIFLRIIQLSTSGWEGVIRYEEL